MKKIKRNTALTTASTTRAPPLHLSTVPTRSYASEINNQQQQLQLQQRAFNLPEAPTFRPTKEEFRDPINYIEKIRPQAEKAGICKIIPPEGWNPTFALDTETFRFETRVQKLNSMEGETRTNLNYLEQLYKWHRQAGHPVTRIPMLDKKPIDLFRLKKEVTARGGIDKVTEGKKWAEIGRVLKLDRKTCTSLSNSLKQAYTKICLPYEQFLEKQSRLAAAAGKIKTPVDETTTPEIEIGATPASPTPDEPNELTTENTPTPPSTIQPQNPPSFTPTPSSLGVSTPQTPPKLSPSSGARRSTRARKSTNPGDGSPHSISSRENSDVPHASPYNASTSNLPASSLDTLSPHDTPRPQTPNSTKRNSDNVTPAVDATLSPSKQHKRQKTTPEKSRTASRYKELDTDDSEPDSETVLPEVCEVCHDGCNPDQMLLCDGCDKGYHIYCLVPPLASIPKSEWYCTQCLVQSGDDYGFEEGEEYSLSAFQKKADEFKQQWFSMYPDAVGVGPNGEAKGGEKFERIVEKEFWRLVESPHAACEVEYGADLHSTVHGSGFPTVEKYPTDPYSTHGWNLNIMPVLRDSLFSHIKSDISGMMIPWLYVGMCFSTFCWHNEDHYTYSINYMHWGETKTWYGIPSSDAEKFEDAMKNAVPELFESNPDLLFQLVTMLSPGRLISSGVNVVALDQRPGQFVITFPQAYHAGFNHGFNFAEAVNFAPSDWEPYGLACVQRYHQYRKMPVFSHDELLITTFQNDSTIRTAVWLKEALTRRRDQEIEIRNKVRNAHGRGTSDDHVLNQVVESGDRPDDQARCAYCHVYCYFSALSCSCAPTKFMCLNHEEELCRCDPAKHTLHVRFDDAQLDQIVRQVSDRAAAPTLWVEKLEKAMTAATVAKKPPSLKSLRGLLAEADGIPQPLDQVGSLKVFVDRANAWVEKVSKLVVRKQHSNRTTNTEKKRSKKYSSNSTSSTKQRNAKLEDVISLLEESEILYFDAPEVRLLRELWRAVSTFRIEARKVLDGVAAAAELSKVETLRDIGLGLNVDMEEMKGLEMLIKELEWRRRAKRKLEIANKGGGFEETKKVEIGENADELIRQAIGMGLPRDDELVTKLVQARDEGIRLEKRLARILKLDYEGISSEPEAIAEEEDKLLSTEGGGGAAVVDGTKEPVTLESLKTVLDQAWKTAASDRILTKAQAMYNRASSLSRHAKTLLERADTTSIEEPVQTPISSSEVTTTPAKRTRISSSSKSRKPTYTELESVLKSEDARHFLTLLEMPELERLKEEATVCEKWSTKGRRMFGRMGGASKPLLALLEETEVNVQICTVEEEIRNGEEEDAGMAGGRKYCLCRKEESGFMLECPICKEWYHGTCVKVNRKQANALSRYTCPICDVTQTIPRTGHRPRLTDLESLLQEGRKMRFEPEELSNLQVVVRICSRFRERIQRYLSLPPAEVEPFGIKHYLRKLEGMEIHLADETRRFRDLILNSCPLPPDPSQTQERRTKALTARLASVEKEYARLLKERIDMFDSLETEQDLADGVFLAREKDIVRCVCDRPDSNEPGQFFVACDRCNIWSHGNCVGVDEGGGGNVEEWFCASCTYKKARRSELLTKHYAEMERAKSRAVEQAMKSLEEEEEEEDEEKERVEEVVVVQEKKKRKEEGRKRKKSGGDDGDDPTHPETSKSLKKQHRESEKKTPHPTKQQQQQQQQVPDNNNNNIIVESTSLVVPTPPPPPPPDTKTSSSISSSESPVAEYAYETDGDFMGFEDVGGM